MPTTRTLAVFLAVLVLGVALLGACDDESGDGDESVLDVRVTEGGLEPETVNVRVPEQLTLNVENATGSTCLFHLGPWIRLDVAPDTEASMSFTIQTEVEGQRTDMGCEGRGLEGTVEVTEITSSP